MKFSVLIPTRNRLDLLARAIETVRRQDYEDWEIIVSDNSSEEDIAGYITSLSDLRIKYYRTDKFIPVTDNWNNALDKSIGDYVVMLGDDDCLMKGYFSTLVSLIEKFDSPDFLYTNAFLYAYPGVMPGEEDGFLRTYSNRKIFESARNPFLLERYKALDFVNDSLNFKVTFDYNMQFSLVSRKLIEIMAKYGKFYQSPYPDYYATNAIMLKAKRILVVPQPLVTIGISPKSFGFYYFNDTESEGDKLLNNLPDKEMVKRLQEIILPGSTMNTSWLFSMETLVSNYGREYEIRVNYSRYRFIQIFFIFVAMNSGQKGGNTYTELKKKLNYNELVRYWYLLFVVVMKLPNRYRSKIIELIQQSVGSHPKINMPKVEGEFFTILDVFEQIDPITCDINIK